MGEAVRKLTGKAFLFGYLSERKCKYATLQSLNLVFGQSGGGITYYEYEREHRFASKKVLERITGAPFPSFSVLEYTKGRIHFRGSYSDLLLIEFKEYPSDCFYQALDRLASSQSSGWSNNNDDYEYRRRWMGRGLPPKRVPSEYMFYSPVDNMTLEIHIEKGNKQVKIESSYSFSTLIDDGYSN
jgi:hypothetical protein